MSDCYTWLTRRRQNQHTYIYIYNPEMRNSSLFHRCFLSLIFVFCLIIVLILTGVLIYHFNRNALVLKSSSNQYEIALAHKRQLPKFVNLNIDPCEHFYEFVCDQWTKQRKKHSRLEETFEDKSKKIRNQLHDQLMTNITNDSILSIYQFYQLCERQSPDILLDEFETYISNLTQQEPYQTYLTIFNQTESSNSILEIIFPEQNPFFEILSVNQTIILRRVFPRLFTSPLNIFSNFISLNQTALIDLIAFNSNYTKFFQELNQTIPFYQQEYHEDSLIIKRILTYSNYHQCLSIFNQQNNGLQNLIELLNYFLQYRLRQFNTNLIDKQIRILNKLNDNHTLVEHLKRIRMEFHLIDEIIPNQYRINNSNMTCIINLLDQLLDQHFQLNEISSDLNLYLSNSEEIYFLSSDWPYLMLIYDRLLKNLSSDILTNFLFFDSYRRLIYPYYQPHRHNLIYLNKLHSSCLIRSCFDILNCTHPSLINQIINDQSQISMDSIKKTVENLIARFRFLIEQSDNLFTKEKNVLIKQFNQMKILLGHSSTKSSFSSLPNLNSSSYLEYVQYLSTLPSDQHIRSYSIEPIYSLNENTLFLPYGFLYLSNSSIEYTLTHFLLKILSKNLQTNPFYIECLIKSFDDTNSTFIDTNPEHIVYLLFRSKFLIEQNINLDEYLWPFMNANSLMKEFLIHYTADHYCSTIQTYEIFLNNTYLIDDVHLIFQCQQASSIQQSKCTVN